MIVVEQAFKNIDNVVANATMTRKEHMILVESIQVIRKAIPGPEVEDQSKKDSEPVCKICEMYGHCDCVCEKKPEGDDVDE